MSWSEPRNLKIIFFLPCNSLGGFVINGEETNDWSGLSVSSAGDVNGDGLDDFLTIDNKAS
jgi:hypothetical protein